MNFKKIGKVLGTVDSHFLSWLRIVSKVVNYTSEFVSRTQEKFPWKKLFYLSVNVFSSKVQIEDTIFTSPTGDGAAILRGHPIHAKANKANAVPLFLSYCMILSISPGPRIELVACRSTLKPSDRLS